MPKKKRNKWLYLYVVQGDYGSGYEDLTQSEVWNVARDDYRAYRLNEPGASHRRITRRELNMNGARYFVGRTRSPHFTRHVFQTAGVITGDGVGRLKYAEFGEVTGPFLTREAAQWYAEGGYAHVERGEDMTRACEKAVAK